MTNKINFTVYLTLICIILSNTGVNADVPKLISYQGRIMDLKTGEPVHDGLYDFTFRLYCGEDTDYSFWTETHYNVQVLNGLYNIMLGSVSEFDNIDFSNQYWLGVQMGIAPEMTPRYQLSASPYALNIADNKVNTQKIQDGSITNDDLHGRITYAEITDENGEYQFTLSKHNPKLQFIGEGYVNVDFNADSQAIIIGVGRRGSGGKSTEWIRTDSIIHLTHSGDSVGIGTANPAYKLDIIGEMGIGGANEYTGRIHFRNATSATEVTLQSGITTSDYSLTLPTSQGDTGYVMVNDGSGNLSWADFNDSDWVYLSDSNYMYATNAAASNSYIRVYDAGQSQALQALHPTENNGECAIKGVSDSTGAFGAVGYMDTTFGGFGVYGYAGATGGAAGVAGVYDLNNYGALGMDEKGVYGIGTEYGGYFSPTVGIEPQDSTPTGVVGGLYVLDSLRDSLFFYNDSAWMPIVTGPYPGLQEAYEHGNTLDLHPMYGDLRVFSTYPITGEVFFLHSSTNNVGIGTTDPNPTYKLDINGKLRVRDTLTLGTTDSFTFPVEDGTNGQVLKTDGLGNLSFHDVHGPNCAHWVIDNPATPKVLYTGFGGNCNAMFLGVAKATSNVHGDSAHTHVNFGRNSTTGTPGNDYRNCTVGGGEKNMAYLNHSTVCGGYQNTANDSATTVGGGFSNTATGDYSIVSGGYYNQALKPYSIVCGGESNKADGEHSVVSGGYQNNVEGDYSGIVGGIANHITSSGDTAIIGGGISNLIENNGGAIGGGKADAIFSNGEWSIIGGGYDNTITGEFSAICGGIKNENFGDTSVVSGGYGNVDSSDCAYIGGGKMNYIYSEADYSVISGGDNNSVLSSYSGVFSGHGNKAGDDNGDSAAFIGGGWMNEIKCDYSVIGGGESNSIQDSCKWSFIGGGYDNFAYGKYASIGGGCADSVHSWYSFIGGGFNNYTMFTAACVCGGANNRSVGLYNFVGGGYKNTALGCYSTISGGDSNYTTGAHCTISGGHDTRLLLLMLLSGEVISMMLLVEVQL